MSQKRAPGSGDVPVTEQVNPRTRDLDQLPTGALLERILAEDASVADAVRATLPDLERACETLVTTLSGNGRWLNLGAGTSGRIGALDAAEIPPTFGLAADRVQALIAGGDRALSQAVEGAEDDPAQAALDLEARHLGPADALVVLSASGRTPYALGAAEHARRVGAKTVAITCAPDSPLVSGVDVAIVARVGPEVIAGSTRMKGGLAQKMILHTLSTAVMVRLGRVDGNRMTGIRAVNEKLRERALAILMELGDCTPAAADRALAAADGSLADALAALRVKP